MATCILYAQSLNVGKLDVPLCILIHLHGLFGSTSVTLYFWSAVLAPLIADQVE